MGILPMSSTGVSPVREEAEEAAAEEEEEEEEEEAIMARMAMLLTPVRACYM
jgi:hypothetical protein